MDELTGTTFLSSKPSCSNEGASPCDENLYK